jgi:Xaa-Pro aminopeptidase
MNIYDFINIHQELSHYNFLHASKVICKLRKIKSKIEIENIINICSIANKVFYNFPEKIYANITEREVASIFKNELIKNSADYIMYMACTSTQARYDQIISNPTQKKLENGDILIIHTTSTLNNYFCDFNRNFGFGKINNSSIDAYKRLYEATELTLENIKPSISYSEIYYFLSKNLVSKEKNVASV